MSCYSKLGLPVTRQVSSVTPNRDIKSRSHIVLKYLFNKVTITSGLNTQISEFQLQAQNIYKEH
jgi:hypothetical protein